MKNQGKLLCPLDKNVEQIEDALISAHGVSCNAEGYAPDLYGDKTVYAIPAIYRVTVDYKKLAAAVYEAGFRKVDTRVSAEFDERKAQQTDKKEEIMNNQLLVVRANIFLRNKEYKDLCRSIEIQRTTGVIMLPPYCETIVVPKDIEIKIEAPIHNPALDVVTPDIKPKFR